MVSRCPYGRRQKAGRRQGNRATALGPRLLFAVVSQNKDESNATNQGMTNTMRAAMGPEESRIWNEDGLKPLKVDGGKGTAWKTIRFFGLLFFAVGRPFGGIAVFHAAMNDMCTGP